ncbi:MAG: response regulator transcription factor [Dehalococcoidia bacterium]
MKVLFVKLPEEISRYIPLVLKVRWPDASLLRTDEADEALQLVHSDHFDLALLHLPGRSEVSSPEDCFDLISQIRAFSDLPLIVISESDDVTDRIKALEIGADDWIPPYFSPMEFIAKVNAILRRCAPHKPGLSFFLDGKLSIDYATRQVCISGRPVKLTPIQYRIFSYLAQNEGRVCTASELLRYVWGPNSGDDKELLKLNVYRLRSRIERDPSNGSSSRNHVQTASGYLEKVHTNNYGE